MKRLLWIFIMAVSIIVSGCSDEETQQISCAIQVPSDGETIQVRAGESYLLGDMERPIMAKLYLQN